MNSTALIKNDPGIVVGKECKYRPLFHSDIKTSKVEKVEKLYKCDGGSEHQIVFFVMENGDKVHADQVYFLESVASANA